MTPNPRNPSTSDEPSGSGPHLPTPEAAAAAREAAANPDTWLDEHGDFLLRFTLARVRDRDVAEDLVQETFVAAMRARERFAGGSALRTWLVGILKHKILDHFRAKARTVLADDLVSQNADGSDPDEGFFNRVGHWKNVLSPRPWAPAPDEAVERNQFRRILDQCISKLPDQMGRLFVLREIEEMESEEVCEILGITPSNLYTTLHRARFRLRRCLELNWFGEGRGLPDGGMGANLLTTPRTEGGNR